MTAKAELSEEPTEEETAKAMEEAKKEAEKLHKTVATEGSLRENATKISLTTQMGEWLFDSARKEGDTTILEDNTGHQYYVLAFEKRYRDEDPTVDVRIIVTEGADGQTILDEWKNGAATEDSFIELCKQYSVDSTASTGGLMEGITNSNLPENISEWLFSADRVAGETVAITAEDASYSYIMYYIGENDPEWMLNIESSMVTEGMNNYLAECMEGITVEDPKGKLKYLTLEAAE